MLIATAIRLSGLRYDTLATRRCAFRGSQINNLSMKIIILFLAWCLLLVLCWPLALLALVLAPLVWLLSLPLRLIGICVEAVFAMLRALLLLPARLLGYRPKHC